MYCTYCNHQNDEGNKFCEKCGKPLVRQQTTLSSTPIIPLPSQTSWARRLASIGGAIVIYCFFLPWLLVSCSVNVGNNTGIEVSGYDIASGNYKLTQNLSQLSTLFGGNVNQTSNTNNSFPLLALIPLLGAIGLLSLNGRVSGSIVTMLTGFLGIGGMAIFTIAALTYGNELTQSMLLQLGFRIGFWGTWLGFLWQVVVAIMTVRKHK